VQWSVYASMGIGYYQIQNGADIDRYNSLRDPIPLTPEILEKAGFVCDNKKMPKYRYKVGAVIYEFSIREHFGIENGNCGIMGIAYDPEDIDMGNGKTKKQGYEWCGFSWHIKYVHQLQNIFFALTHEELPIQL